MNGEAVVFCFIESEPAGGAGKYRLVLRNKDIQRYIFPLAEEQVFPVAGFRVVKPDVEDSIFGRKIEPVEKSGIAFNLGLSCSAGMHMHLAGDINNQLGKHGKRSFHGIFGGGPKQVAPFYGNAIEDGHAEKNVCY